MDRQEQIKKYKADKEKLNKHMEEIKLMLDEPMELNKKNSFIKIVDWIWENGVVKENKFEY